MLLILAWPAICRLYNGIVRREEPMKTLNTLNVLLPAFAAAAISINLTVTRRGGLTFFRVGRFGGSVYWSKHNV